MRPLRIAHLIDSLQTGGAEVMLASLAQIQRERGDDVRVFCLLQRGPLEERLRKASVDVYQCRHNPIQSSLAGKLGTIAELRREFRAWRADLLHCHNITPTLYGAPAARLAGVRAVICTRHGFLMRPEWVRKEKRFWRVLRGCCKVVAVSDSVASEMAALPYARPSQIVIIRNGASTLPVRPGNEPKTAFTAITVARLAAPKDHATLLRAMALIAPQIPDLKTLIVGGGPMEGELRALTAELGIGGQVNFLGDRDDVGNWLARSDVFVLSSRSEGLPISMLEAMAAGLPMIMSDVGGIREAVGHLLGVRLVPAENPSMMADALLEFSRRRQELPALGQANQRYFRQNYSAESMTDAYAALYAECLGHPRPKAASAIDRTLLV